ncbi:Phosphoserine phosphatase, variant 2 [Clonorchis sinensis]|uniref:Phosphoserine phosphatase n=3 Tax=Clonorchis sinensis TaxID=79923 RepID=A0A8T1MA19_CLOSI|nr:Phosphoserine phosphatase, variant 2 [Clonorchis sinensis]
MPPYSADWSSIGCVCFDVDSTVCVDEGIDELARFLGCESEVQAVTSKAMNGELDFTQSLIRRLEIMRPSRSDIQRFLSFKQPSLTSGTKDVVQRLQDNGLHVCLVSGGFYPLVEPVAKLLNVPLENVYCNQLLFRDDGAYLGFDDTAPTCRSDGKATVVDGLIRRFQTGVIIVGDGMTDAKACPPATFFIGFGGNADRPPVRAATPYFCTTMQELLDLFRSVGLVL